MLFIEHNVFTIRLHLIVENKECYLLSIKCISVIIPGCIRIR